MASPGATPGAGGAGGDIPVAGGPGEPGGAAGRRGRPCTTKRKAEKAAAARYQPAPPAIQPPPPPPQPPAPAAGGRQLRPRKRAVQQQEQEQQQASESSAEEEELPAGLSKHKSGAVITQPEIDRILYAVHMFTKEFPDRSGTRMAAEYLGYCRNKVQDLWKDFEAGKAPVPAKAPPPPPAPWGATSAVIRAHAGEIRAFLLSKRLGEGSNVEAKDIAAFIKGTEWGCDLSLSLKFLRKSLRRLGFTYGRARVYAVGKEKEHVVAARSQYALGVLKDERGPPKEGVVRVVLYLDESYINRNHRRGFTWYHNSEKKPGEMGGRSGKGERLCFLAAITEEYGILAETIYIFKAKATGDYHASMDGERFLWWLDVQAGEAIHRLHAKHEKRLVVVLKMDNAAYHRVAQKLDVKELVKEGDPAGLRREMLINWLEAHDIPVDARRAPRGDTVAAMQAKAEAYLREHPEQRVQNAIQKWCADLSAKLGIPVSVVYTPPYHPELQPIELLWAMVKRRIAARYNVSRTMDQIWAELEAELRTCGSAEQCKKFVAHVRKFEDMYMAMAEADRNAAAAAAAAGAAPGPSSAPCPATSAAGADGADSSDSDGIMMPDTDSEGGSDGDD